VSREDGERLQSALPVGARLVSKEGDLWRWDGFVARADAPKPAAVRLEQRNRLSEVETEIAKLSPAATEASLAHQGSTQRVNAADEALRNARRAPLEAERALGAARDRAEQLARETVRRDARAQALNETLIRLQAEYEEAKTFAVQAEADLSALPAGDDPGAQLTAARETSTRAREAAGVARSALDNEGRERAGRARRMEALDRDWADWSRRAGATDSRLAALAKDRIDVEAALIEARTAPEALEERKLKLLDDYKVAEARRDRAADSLADADSLRIQADREQRTCEQRAAEAREHRATLTARLDAARERLAEMAQTIRDTIRIEPDELGRRIAEEATAVPTDASGIEAHLMALERERDQIGAVNLRAEEESIEYATRLEAMRSERADLTGAIGRLRDGIESLNAEGRERLLAAFDVINGHFQTLFQALFSGGQAELRLIESDDPLEAGLEIFACPPGKRLSTMSLMSGGEQALTAAALIFGVFLANPAPICVLDEVDAPLDDANVDRFCNMLAEMRQRTQTRFIAITHNPVTMSRMDRLFGVTMPEQGVSQLVSVDLKQAEAMVTP
jgi:chromosome segregation protein